MNELDPKNYVLILSVGSTPDPLIKSIGWYKPAYVIFVASEESSSRIEEIISKSEGIARYETIILSNYQNLLACVREIRAEIPKKLAAMHLPQDILLVGDITGGTKVMSAALTLALMEFNSRFTYVGGERHEGPGWRVMDGKEIVLPMDNPWEAMGIQQAGHLVMAFNAGQYRAAKEEADFLMRKDTMHSKFYAGLSKILNAFRCWDAFDYKSAIKDFGDGLAMLAPYKNRHNKDFDKLYAELDKAGVKLAEAAKEAEVLSGAFSRLEDGYGRAYLKDVLANATRCAGRGHYDDAVARLYSIIEKTAKIALAQHGIDNSAVDKTFLSDTHPELSAKHAHEEGDTVKLPLQDSFALFCRIAPDHTVACSFTTRKDALDKALTPRNLSLLAHGYDPINQGHYHRLHNLALEFLGIAEADLPVFPQLSLNAILFK